MRTCKYEARELDSLELLQDKIVKPFTKTSFTESITCAYRDRVYEILLMNHESDEFLPDSIGVRHYLMHIILSKAKHDYVKGPCIERN